MRAGSGSNFGYVTDSEADSLFGCGRDVGGAGVGWNSVQYLHEHG